MSEFVYILRLKSGGLYIGVSHDVNKRYAEHCRGKASRTTRLDPPVAIMYTEQFETVIDARRREAQLKHWTRAKKEALIEGDMEKLRSLSKPRKP
jgi:putative endonuclease